MRYHNLGKFVRRPLDRMGGCGYTSLCIENEPAGATPLT